MANLEKKTKKELIEIISRKDSVEVSLRKDLEGTEKNLKSKVDELIALKNEKDSLIKKHHNELKSKNDEIESLKLKYNSKENELQQEISRHQQVCNELHDDIDDEIKRRVEYQIACGILAIFSIGLLIAFVCVL